MTDAVAVIAKAPTPGTVKTRLCPPLTLEEAAAVATALLLDSYDSATAAGGDVWCAFTGDEAALRAVLPPGARLLRQRGTDFAERLANAQSDLFGLGYDRVVLYGADCPTVDAAYLRTALAALDDADVVLGPATDGGYTLLASADPTPALFAGVAMGTDRALGDTLARAASARLTVRLLAERHDVDTLAGLRAALVDGQLAGAPLTAAAAQRLAARQLAEVSPRASARPPAHCGACGRELATGGHDDCARLLTLDPPRFCALCGFRLAVQVFPDGDRSHCRECRRRARAAPGRPTIGR